MPIENCHAAIRRTNIILIKDIWQMLLLNVLYLAYQTQKRSFVLNQIQFQRTVSIMSIQGNLTALPKSFAGQEVSLHILQRSLESRSTFIACEVWEAEHAVSKLGLQSTDLLSFCLAWSSGRAGLCLILSWTCSCIVGPQIYKISFTCHYRNTQAFQID